METLLQQIGDWLKNILIEGILQNLNGMFEAINRQVGEVAADIGSTPADFSPGVFSLVRNISETVIIPIAGIILTFIACYELIQMLIEHNHLANFETWLLFQWVMKTFIAVTLISNTFNIILGGGTGVFFWLRRKKTVEADVPDPDDLYEEEDLRLNPPETPTEEMEEAEMESE